MASQGAIASSLKVRGGVTSNSYALDRTSAAGVTTNLVDTTYGGSGLGLTWMSDDASIYLDYALSTGSGTYTDSLGTWDISRTDNAIVVGSNSMGSTGIATNFYAGWKNGTTKMGWTSTQDLQFDVNGFIFGGGWGIPAGGGAVLLNLGMGIMSGQYQLTGAAANEADMALGYSLGIGYTYPFTQNFGATVDYKLSGYNYTFLQGTTSEWSLAEKFSTTGASVYLKF